VPDENKRKSILEALTRKNPLNSDISFQTLAKSTAGIKNIEFFIYLFK